MRSFLLIFVENSHLHDVKTLLQSIPILPSDLNAGSPQKELVSGHLTTAAHGIEVLSF